MAPSYMEAESEARRIVTRCLAFRIARGDSSWLPIFRKRVSPLHDAANITISKNQPTRGEYPPSDGDIWIRMRRNQLACDVWVYDVWECEPDGRWWPSAIGPRMTARSR